MFWEQLLSYQEKALNLHFQNLQLVVQNLARASKISVLVILQKSFQNDQENQIGTYFGLLQRRFR